MPIPEPGAQHAPPLPDPELFDADVLGAMFDHDAMLIAPLLKTFVASTNTSLAELSRTVAERDLPTTVSLAHRVAGASRLSGARLLGDVAATLEAAAKGKDMGPVPAALQQLTLPSPQVQPARGPLHPG